MLQVMLCVICIMSVALLCYDFVIIPRQNRELVEDLKSHFPEEFPPGGGSPTQKEEQAGTINRKQHGRVCLVVCPTTLHPCGYKQLRTRT